MNKLSLLERARRMGPLDWGKLSVKLITAVRFGMDTFFVAVGGVGATAPPVVVLEALLDVLLIDVFFTLMWSVSAYAGTSQQAMAVRPFATLAAWVMYAVILIIGGATRDIVSVAVRVTGGLALTYDTYGYIQDWWRQRRAVQESVTLEQANARRRSQMWKRAYGFALRTYGAVAARFQSFGMVHYDLQQDLRRLRHRASEFSRELDVEEGVVLEPPALPEVVKHTDAGPTWTCPYCGHDPGRVYESEGIASAAFKLHMKKDIPEHRHATVQ